MSDEKSDPQESDKQPLELSAEDLTQVVGGVDAATVAQDITVRKAKTADKAFAAMDDYIKG
jgi:hypothetical protein